MAAQQKVEEVVFNQPKVGGMLSLLVSISSHTMIDERVVLSSSYCRICFVFVLVYFNQKRVDMYKVDLFVAATPPARHLLPLRPFPRSPVGALSRRLVLVVVDNDMFTCIICRPICI